MSTQAALLLLADSQLLFRPQALSPLIQHFAGRSPRAAYVGAANGHQPEFYELACAALEALFGRPVPCAFVRGAMDISRQPVDLLILAGGSVSRGWEFLQQPDVQLWVNNILAQEPAAAIGVSAGAIHLGRGCDPEQPSPVAQSYLDAFPHFIAVHEEQQAWPSRAVWRADGSAGEFIPIPFGGGLWVQNGKRTTLGTYSGTNGSGL